MTSVAIISDQLISQITTRLRENKRIRYDLPLWGRIHIDRQLPFLCIYRRPTRRADAGTERLIMGQPAYLVASGHKSLAPGLTRLVTDIARAMSVAFGCFLIIEIWATDESYNPDVTFPTPAFDVIVSNQDRFINTLDTLENELAQLKAHQIQANVSVMNRRKPAPPRLPLLLPKAVLDELGGISLGIAVRPVYRHTETGEILPLIHQAIIRDFNRALQRTFFTFVHRQTKYHPPHYQMLGRHAMVKSVWYIDKQLAEIGNSFDFLLQVTPVNTHEAWTKFKQYQFQKLPTFRYRPHVADPALLKRQLWNVRVERVEDPTLQHLFREKQKELDIKLSMLGAINKRNFIYGSLQLYGTPDNDLTATAKQLLGSIPPHSREQTEQKLTAEAFARYASAEIDRYQQAFSGFDAQVYIQPDISSLMVSRGNLLVSDKIKIPASRAEALVSHEIGVHALTYFNGQAQPFKLLYAGLAGYDELQEGLAVLAEYLVGGLSQSRLRLLAARVIAAHSLIDGATFIDTFRLLQTAYGFKPQPAFNLVMRIYRGGGLTKDAIYLRGLIQLLHYLQQKPLHDLFFIGKIAISHIPIIQELQRRQVLQPPKLRPHFLDTPAAQLRLARVSQGLSIIELIERNDP